MGLLNGSAADGSCGRNGSTMNRNRVFERRLVVRCRRLLTRRERRFVRSPECVRGRFEETPLATKSLTAIQPSAEAQWCRRMLFAGAGLSWAR